MARVRSAPAESHRSERERLRWLEAKRSAGRGRRAAGDALFVWFAPGTGLTEARGAGGGTGTGRAAVRGGRRSAGRQRRRVVVGGSAADQGWGGGGGGGGAGQEAPGKELPAPSSHHYRAAFLRMALPRVAPRRGSAPQTPGRSPAL